MVRLPTNREIAESRRTERTPQEIAKDLCRRYVTDDLGLEMEIADAITAERQAPDTPAPQPGEDEIEKARKILDPYAWEIGRADLLNKLARKIAAALRSASQPSEEEDDGAEAAIRAWMTRATKAERQVTSIHAEVAELRGRLDYETNSRRSAEKVSSASQSREVALQAEVARAWELIKMQGLSITELQQRAKKAEAEVARLAEGEMRMREAAAKVADEVQAEDEGQSVAYYIRALPLSVDEKPR